MIDKEITIQEKLAYLAGIIDGEGHIGVYKTYYKNKTDRYRTRVCVSTTSNFLIEWLLKEFGGFVKKKKMYSNKHKQGFTWQLSDKDADHVLEMVLPYLVIKRSQAILYLSYRKLQKTTPKTYPGHSEVNTDLRREIHEYMKSLNSSFSESVETNTLDFNSLLKKIESELNRNVKRRIGDNLSVG